MREIGSGVQHDPVCQYRSAEVQLHSCIILHVDSPGFVGPFSVGAVRPDTVNGVFRCEYTLASGLHIGCRMRITGNIHMLIRRIQCQVSIDCDLIFSCDFRIEIMFISGKYLRGHADPFLPEGNIIGYIVGYVYESIPKSIIHL